MLRRSLVVLTIACVVSASVPRALADQFRPKMNTPTSLKDVLFGLQETRDNVAGVSCGGWNEPSSGQANGTTVSGDVPLPDVSADAPGRKNVDPLELATQGIGKRGNFEFPDSAFGYLSACNTADRTIHDDDLAKLGFDITFDDVDVDEDPNVRLVPGSGEIDINPYHWCRRENIFEKATPRWCEKLFKTWLQMAAIAPRPIPNPLCADPPEKKYCFDLDFTKTCDGQDCRTKQGPAFGNKLTECHLEQTGTDSEGNPTYGVVIDVGGYQYADMSTYYRHYGGAFSDWSEVKDKNRSPLTVSTPTKTWKLRAECYEYYRESDPESKVTGQDDRQCEIVVLTEDEQSPDSPEWEDGGPGGEKQKDKVKADPPVVREDPRAARAVSDPWVADTQTNLSIVDVQKLKDAQKNQGDPLDITAVMSTILGVKQRGGKTVPTHARADAFSDDGRRGFTVFWERQQRELQKMVTDTTTRLVMPARFLVGLADDDPLYQYVRGIVSRSDGTVEMTLRAGNEDIGNVLESLQRVSIGPVQQVRIPIVLPLVSEQQIDLLIFQWQQWREYEDRDAVANLRPTNGGEADRIIAKLQDYKTALLRTRRLRNALVAYLGKIFTYQKDIRGYVADWYEENSDLLRQAAERGVQRRELKEVWRDVQKILLEADESQMHWCANQRYSVPVYSLLDLWWGERAPGEDRDQAYVPGDDMDVTTIGYAQPQDQEYDFSAMKFSRESVLIPVLWPIQVTLKLPQPPPVGTKPDSASDMPDIPAIPDETIFDSFAVPAVNLPAKGLIAVPSTQDLQPAIDRLTKFKDLAQRMKETYEQFQPSVLVPPDPEQKTGKPEKMIHVENDLKERIARLFSRWEPGRKVDVAGRAARVNGAVPKPACHEDVVCYFLPPEKKTSLTWQWYVPASVGGFTPLADAIKNAVLPADEAHNPFDAPSLPVLERFFPALDQPVTIKLEKSRPATP